MRVRFLMLSAVWLAGASCSTASQAPGPAVHPTARPPAAPASAAPTLAPTPQPTPELPAYYIESLRARGYPGGQLQVGDQMFRGPGYTKSHMSWPSGGQTMTGTISMPDGQGPFPVAVVNHGFIPPERYWIGQDSGIFGDVMAAHGIISVAPNWPGYSGSGPGAPGVPPIVAETIASLDLISSLATVPQADMSRIAMVGHSNGGGISQLAMVVDPRVKAVVLHGPVSSDMADNARKWWLNTPGGAGPAGSPDSNPDGYYHMSPRNYFQAGQPPVLIIQGTADHTIPAAWTQSTLAAMQARGIQARVSWYQGADHDFVGADLAGAVAEQEAFLRTTLGF